MRVIGGKFRSRSLLAPVGWQTRPTSDRLRETLMNVLENGAVNRLHGAKLLDLYAGTGAVGIEALSRGAQSVTFVERDAKTMATLEDNCAQMGLAREVHLVRAAVAHWMRRVVLHGNTGAQTGQTAFELVFLDPPWDDADGYTQTLGLLGADAASLLTADAWVIAEHRRKTPLPERFGCLARWRLLEQGDAALSFYQPSTSVSDSQTDGSRSREEDGFLPISSSACHATPDIC